jgi:hypothetical protein
MPGFLERTILEQRHAQKRPQHGSSAGGVRNGVSSAKAPRHDRTRFSLTGQRQLHSVQRTKCLHEVDMKRLQTLESFSHELTGLERVAGAQCTQCQVVHKEGFCQSETCPPADFTTERQI